MNLLATTSVTTDSPSLPSPSTLSYTHQRVKWLEPIPTRFYCPRSIYEDWESEKSESSPGFPGVWLGDEIKSPGGSYTYQVQSGPCCRLYYGNGYAETHSFERGWKPKDDLAYARDPIGYGAIGKNWTRVGANYLSYQVKLVDGKEITNLTVRWESPIDKTVEVAKVCTLVCPLVKPLIKEEGEEAQVDLVA